MLLRKSVELTVAEMKTLQGYLRDYPGAHEPTLTKTIVFTPEYEMDVKLCPVDEETEPFSEAVLFYNGTEVACTECSDDPSIIGVWELEVDNGTEVMCFSGQVLEPDFCKL